MCFYYLFAAGSSHLVSEHFPWHKWEIFFSSFQQKEGKIGQRISYHFLKLSAQNQKKQVAYLNSSFKNTQFQKTNHLIWSSKSGDIADLKSTIFQNFGDGHGNCGAKIYWLSAQVSIPISWIEAEWLFQFRKYAIIAILSNIDPVFEHWVEFLPKIFFLLQVRIWE